MTEFKKYNEIENSYNQKSILKHLEYNPDLKHAMYIAREKLDGANIQLAFEFDEFNPKFKVGKRTSFLEPGEPFFDIWVTLKKYDKEIWRLAKLVSDECATTVRVYGEIFGPGVNGRVNYGPEKQISFFDMYINDLLISQEKLQELFEKYELTHMLPPLVGYYNSLSQALEAPHEFDSKILNIPDNITEGIVIIPYKSVIRMPNGERFILKKKNEKFSEKMKVKVTKEKEPMSGEALEALTAFKEYINENRVLSAFSKMGPIQDQKQIGEYLKVILDDAKKDFFKDNPDLVLSDDASKTVFNVGKDIVALLRAHL